MADVVRRALTGKTKFFQELNAYFYECNDVFIRKEIIPLVMDQ